MEFRLIYEGQLAPRRRISLMDLNAIRLALSPQLQRLWQFTPLADEVAKYLRPNKGDGVDEFGIFENRGSTVFAPLVTDRLCLQCALDVTFLRQQAPGQLIGEGGDIDNRLKTLLDALSVPPMAQQAEFRSPPTSEPVFCLLQDDSLVTKLAVETDRLLRPTSGENDMVAIIKVKVGASRLTFSNIGLVG